MTQVVESCGIWTVNTFIQQQGKLFRCFKADDLTSVNCGEPLGGRQCGNVWGGVPTPLREGSYFIRIK